MPLDLSEVPKSLRPYFESEVLDPDKHTRLAGEIKTIACAAGIPDVMIYTSARDFCKDSDIEWAKNYNHLDMSENGGLVYTKGCTDVGVRMFALAGAFIRNFISPVVMTVQEVISVYKANNEVSDSVLLIPNFYLSKSSGGDIPTWQSSMLLGMLLARYAEGKKTILYIENMKAMEADYGTMFSDHVKTHFKIIES